MVKSFRIGTSWSGVETVLLLATLLQTACGLGQQILYNRSGRQAGLQYDPTTKVIGLGEIGSGPAPPK